MINATTVITSAIELIMIPATASPLFSFFFLMETIPKTSPGIAEKSPQQKKDTIPRISEATPKF